MKPPRTDRQIMDDKDQAAVDYYYNYTAVDELRWEPE